MGFWITSASLSILVLALMLTALLRRRESVDAPAAHDYHLVARLHPAAIDHGVVGCGGGVGDDRAFHERDLGRQPQYCPRRISHRP